jgi:hypothetical protein
MRTGRVPTPLASESHALAAREVLLGHFIRLLERWNLQSRPSDGSMPPTLAKLNVGNRANDVPMFYTSIP